MISTASTWRRGSRDLSKKIKIDINDDDQMNWKPYTDEIHIKVVGKDDQGNDKQIDMNLSKAAIRQLKQALAWVA